MAIMINDRRLEDLSEHEILVAVTAPDHRSFSSSAYHRNRELLQLFGDREEINEHVLVHRFEKLHVNRGHSPAFKSMRAGELIGWGAARALSKPCPESCCHGNC